MSKSIVSVFWKILAVTLLCLKITAAAGEEKFASEAEMNKFFSGIAGTRTLTSRFVQERRIKGLKHIARIEGRFYMQSDGKIAWIVEKPIKYYCVITPQRIRQYDHEAGSETTVDLSRHPAFAAMVDMMTGFFSGKGFGGSRGVISSEREIFMLPGKDSFAGDMVKKIELTLSAGGDYIEKVNVYAGSGDRTTLRFVNCKLNTAIPESVWNNIRF